MINSSGPESFRHASNRGGICNDLTVGEKSLRFSQSLGVGGVV